MAGYLRSAVDSALRQTYADFELLIVDNVSTDGTYDIAQEYARKDARVRVVRNDRNIGANPNFNKCFDLAHGTWLKFLCADDLLAADCIERAMAAVRPGPLVVNCMEEFILPPDMDPQVRVLHETYWREHSLRLFRRFPNQPYISATEFADLVAEDPTANCISAPSCLIHRQGWERFGRYRLDLITLNDWDLCARVGVHFGVINVADAVTHYRVHGASLSDLLVSQRPYKMDVLCPLIIRHDAVYHADYAPVREAARRRRIDLRYELFDASRHARHGIEQYARQRGDNHAAADWNDMVKQYPGVMAVPPTYYPIKAWRWGMRRLKMSTVGVGMAANLG
jgi:glycosyltransferase involved in cell wall biosynthesis